MTYPAPAVQLVRSKQCLRASDRETRGECEAEGSTFRLGRRPRVVPGVLAISRAGSVPDSWTKSTCGTRVPQVLIENHAGRVSMAPAGAFPSPVRRQRSAR